MKVKTNQNVNIRSIRPYRDTNNLKGTINPGFEIEVEDKLEEGQYIEEGEGVNKIGTSKWYKDKNGDYYWSGGFEERVKKDSVSSMFSYTSFQEEIWKCYDPNTEKLISPIDYSAYLKIDNEFKLTLGRDVLIGVLDHGINLKHKALQGAVENPNEFKSILINSHGSFISGLIAGRNSILGIAPDSKVLELPIYKVENENTRRDSVVKRLKKLLSYNQPIILNVSQDLITDNVIESFSELPENVIVVAAAGTDDELFNSIKQAPANMNNIISVGSLTKEFDISKKNMISTQVDVIIPEFQFISASKNGETGYAQGNGDSYACAIISSICALIISKYASLPTLNSSFLKNKLFEISSPINNDNIKVLTPLNHKK